MKDQIEALYRLQKQDRRVVSIERKLAAIPRRLEEMDRDLAKLEAMLGSELSKLEDSRGFRRDQERQLEEEQEQIRNSKSRMSNVKTPRELNAAQRELESTRRLADKRSKELGEIETAITAAEGRIRGLQSGLDELREQFKGERARLVEEQTRLQESLAKGQKTRKKLVAAVNDQLLRRYERIRKHGGGIGFVPVRERRCAACKMAVAHQTYVSLRNAEIIVNCESCGRLLYWGGLFPEDEKKHEPKPKDAPAPKKRSKGDEGDEGVASEPGLV